MSLSDRIEAILGHKPLHIAPLHGGSIGEVYRVDLPGGQRIAAKIATRSGTLDLEGYMLRYLREHSDLPVPEVLYAEKSLLLMRFIEGSSQLSKPVQEHAAELLAALHSIRAPQFGHERDTLIGGLHQPNPLTDRWLSFFREHRLLAFARAALNEGQLSPALMTRIESFAARLDRWLYEPEYPALIHGDMWTTNILASAGRVTGFVDPAIYYAHPEIELAFSTLFGTFNEAFFRRYDSIHPISPGFFEERRDIYNLYPLLVHVRLFGRGYVGSVESILQRFGH